MKILILGLCSLLTLANINVKKETLKSDVQNIEEYKIRQSSMITDFIEDEIVFDSDVFAPSYDEHGTTEMSNSDIQLVATTTENWNIVCKNLESGTLTFSYFNENAYLIRDDIGSTSSASSFASAKSSSFLSEEISWVDGSLLSATGYYPLAESNNADISVVNTSVNDGSLSKVEDTTQYPYRMCGLIVATYLVTGNNGLRYNIESKGTGFLEGPDLLVTAGHCLYGDVTTEKMGPQFEDYINNPRFPDRIKFFPAQWAENGKINTASEEYIEVKEIYLENYYYTSLLKDWGACRLATKIGNQTGWFGKKSNYYVQNAPFTSFGYPGSKNGQMYAGNALFTYFETENGWYYRTNLDSEGGQSGSPYIIEEDGKTYVVGIHTYSSTGGYTGGIRIDDFMFHFLNSFVTSLNYPSQSISSAYLNLSVVSKSGSIWTIKVQNNTDCGVFVYYNAKMCFENDAKNWTGLSDIKRIYVDKNSFENIQISTNVFATHITVSYNYRAQYRLITYANNLSSSKLTLTQRYNCIGI